MIDNFCFFCSSLGPISHRFRDMAPFIAKNYSLKIAAKLLQMETWLLLTAYKKSPAPYSTVPSPTPYDLATIPHDWLTIVPHVPSKSSKDNDFHVI